MSQLSMDDAGGVTCPLCSGTGRVAADDPTANHLRLSNRPGRSTQRRAASDHYPRSGSRRESILSLFERTAIGGDGLTSDEVERAFGWPHQTVSATIHGLVRGGWLVATGEERPTRFGSSAIVWRRSDRPRP